MAFQQNESLLIGSVGAALPNRVEVYFDGQIVPRLTSSTIIMWNSGTELIRGDHIVKRDPIRLEIPEDGRFLKVDIISFTNSANGCEFKIIDNIVEIHFDYLNSQDGFKIVALHNQPRRKLRVLGSVQGIPSGPQRIGNISNIDVLARRVNGVLSARNSLFIKAAMGICILISCVAISNIFFGFVETGSPSETSIRDEWAIAGFFLSYALLVGVTLWSGRRRYPVSLDKDKQESSSDTAST